MKLTTSAVEALDIAPELKADVLALLGDVEKKETELSTIRAKMPTDSQKIVESVDYDKFTAATQELETLKQQLAAKLDGERDGDGDFILDAFRSFFA
jgi:predicted  nucleic acid-binding Zn-ribbon protein